MTLARLKQLLTVGPPRLLYLTDLIRNLEYVQDFMKLVEKYIPDHLAEIQRMPGGAPQRVTRFMEVFSSQYFPLDTGWWDEEDYASFLGFIPVPRLGISNDDYHETNTWSPGMQVMLAFSTSPLAEWEGSGARVPLLLEVTNLVGRNLARRIPQDGYPQGELHAMLDGTPYEALAHLADLLHHDHENIFLNLDYETDLSDADWEESNVTWLAEQWPEAQRVWDQINDLAGVIEDDPRTAVSTILTIIAAHEAPQDRVGKPLVDVFGTSHAYKHPCGCVLDLDTQRLTTECNSAECSAYWEGYGNDDDISPREAVRTIAEEEGYDVGATY